MADQFKAAEKNVDDDQVDVMIYSVRWKSGLQKLKDILKILTLFQFIISVRDTKILL